METLYLVQIWPDGLDGMQKYQQYQKVYADSAKEAAETSYGGPLHDHGKDQQLRVHVQGTIVGRIKKLSFYER